jgi:ubiquinone/menaquinone biosynthesis C-methylase UbiE
MMRRIPGHKKIHWDYFVSNRWVCLSLSLILIIDSAHSLPFSFRLDTVLSALYGEDTPKTPPSTYKGRVIAPAMSAEGADWLVRADREEFEQPEKVVDALKLEKGMVVADIGAGVGYFSLRIAKRVGPTGIVLAVDIQPEMLDLLKKNQERERLTNVEPILGTVTDPHLPQEMIDLALLVDVYHECQYPEEMMRQIRNSLKKNGRLVLIEYRGEDATVPIKPEHKMTVKQVLAEIEPMGFQLKEQLEFLPWQHILVFMKTNKEQENGECPPFKGEGALVRVRRGMTIILD